MILALTPTNGWMGRAYSILNGNKDTLDESILNMTIGNESSLRQPVAYPQVAETNTPHPIDVTGKY